MYTIEPTTMQITLREKNILLSQIAGVLSDLNCLVSKLMSVKCQDEDDQVKSYPEEDVSSVSSQESGSLLWDTTEDFPVYLPPPPLSLNLFFPESNSDDESGSIQLCQSVIVNKAEPEECPFVKKIESFISSNFPNNIFSEERSAQLRQKRLDEKIIPEFQCLLQNVGDLFIQNPESTEICTTTSSVPEIQYKTVNLSNVNVRNLANIPKPTSFPIHGCSEDPKFYSEKLVLSVDYYGHARTATGHQKSLPFGFLYGYQTNEGIVPVPSTPVNGHIWSHDLRDWVLYAVYPDECSAGRAPRTGTRSPTTRPTSTRRGWSTSRPRREGKG